MSGRYRKGDIFEVCLGDGKCGHFQFIGIDVTMLNSEVIRVFDGIHQASAEVPIEKIVSQGVKFYAHVIIKAGFVLSTWKRIGNSKVINETELFFRASWDYGDPKIEVSKDWYVWRVNDPHTDVGELPQELQSAEIGIVVSPPNIVERMLSGKYKFVYPRF